MPIPDIGANIIIYSIVDTFKNHEHLFCTSIGLIKRDIRLDKKSGELKVTNNSVSDSHFKSFRGERVFQIVAVGTDCNKYAVHYHTDKVAYFDISTDNIIKTFSCFKALRTIVSLQNVTNQPSILIRDEKSLFILNLEVQKCLLLKDKIPYISESLDF